MKIILAVDGSLSSNLAAAEVARRPWPMDTVVQVVTVEAPLESPFLRGSSPTIFDEIVQQQRAEATDRLNQAVSSLQHLAPGLRIHAKLLEGSPKDAIIEEATRWGADLIVVGSHGHGPIRRFFLGSVSLFIAHNAPCSVLIVRGSPESHSNPDDSSTSE